MPPYADSTNEARPGMRLGELLIRRGYATPAHVEQALAEKQRLRDAGQDEWLGQILLRHGHVRPDDLAEALAEQSLIEVF